MNVSVTTLPPDTLIVRWEPPDCLLWNSPLITSYTIHINGAGEEEVEGERRLHQVTGLASFTNYSVTVSAGNGQGRGPPSDPVTVSLITGEWAHFKCESIINYSSMYIHSSI